MQLHYQLEAERFAPKVLSLIVYYIHLQDRAHLITSGQQHRVPDVDERIRELKDKVKELEDKFQQRKQQLLELEQEEG